MTIHQSSHPCLQAKLSQLRSHTTATRETRGLVNEISTILGVEALAGLPVTPGKQDKTPLGVEYTTKEINTKLAIVPILRSGLGMVDSINDLLPTPVPIYHLGLYRERTTLQPVEYYNNLPYHRPSQSSSANISSPDTKPADNAAAADTAILLDPIIATGATAEAAIHLLREWGIERVVMLTVLASDDGLKRVQESWPEGVDVWVGGVDVKFNERGMIVPGLGDIGDRLFVAIGK